MENISPSTLSQRNGLESRKDDFWEALSSNYNYLMNDELIATCREASGELDLDEEARVSPPRETLSFAEFVRQFNLLHDWLHQLQSSLLDSTSDHRAEVAEFVGGELHRRQPSLSLFLEEAEGLAVLHPTLKEEVNRRVNLLSNKREAVQRALDPDRAAALAPAVGEAFQEVAQEMRRLRRWLKELEAQLPSQMTVSPTWTQAEIQERLCAQQVLQQQIESRSVLVKSLLRQCEALCAAGGPPSHAAANQGESATSLQPLFANDAQRIRRVAANLEKRWHALWLRSLEWQCLLEQLLQGSRGLWETGSDCCFGDEPKTKQPRLSCEWDGGSSTASDRTMEIGNSSNSDTKEPRSKDNQLSSVVVPATTASVPPTRLEKGVMVGQTGIADLKLACKGGRRFEVLHDVGYSSESSTQLSSEDCIRIYSYSPELAESVFHEYRDGLVRNGVDECGTGVGPALYKAANEEEYDEGEYEASPLIQSNTSNVDFYKMTLLEDAPSSDHNGDDVAAGAIGQLDDELMDFAELEQLGGDVKACAASVCNGDGKSERVRRWLQNCESAPLTSAEEEEEDPAVAGVNERHVDSSCDASGEYTTNDESEEPGDESDGAASSRRSSRGSSSQGLDTSQSMSLLSKSGTGSVETVVQVGSALSEGDAAAPRVVLRQGLRKKRSRERPWSVIELGPSGALQLCPHSTSETALNLLSSSSTVKAQSRPRTSSVGVQKDPSSPDRRLQRSRGLRGLRSGSSSEALSGSSSAHKRQKSGDDGERRPRRASTLSSTGTTGSLQNASSSSGTENYQDCLPYSSSKSHLFSRAPTLAHVEEQSSVSDQVWDDYQDPPYFSEPYSEQTADEDQMKKLLDFGDDYWAFIGSPSDTSSLSGQPRELPRRSPHKGRPATKPGGTTEFDSDSDIEDLHHLKESPRVPREKMSPPKFAELVATCQTNLHWLKMIRIHLHNGEDSPQLQKLISQWEALVRELQESGRDERDAAPSQADVLHSIDALREELSHVTALVSRPHPMAAEGFQAVERRAHELKVALASLHDIQDSLLDVKVKAHRLGASTEELAIGKHIQALYRQWEDAYEQSGAKLTELQKMNSEEMSPQCPPCCKDTVGGQSRRSMFNGEAFNKRESWPSDGAASQPDGNQWHVGIAGCVALVLLYCVACLLEPHCCDLLNNFHSPFGPQLRYTHGPPPI
ncbi:hypothetical protein MTO96_018451 [Rhipicephalus appendiculatus]